MKNVAFLLLVVLLLSCTGSDQGGLSGGAASPAITAEMIAFLLSGKPEGTDEGLFLYRNPTTRFVVEQFYAGVTADRSVTHAVLAAVELRIADLLRDADGDCCGVIALEMETGEVMILMGLKEDLFDLGIREFPASKGVLYDRPGAEPFSKFVDPVSFWAIPSWTGKSPSV